MVLIIDILLRLGKQMFFNVMTYDLCDTSMSVIQYINNWVLYLNTTDYFDSEPINYIVY